MVRVCVRTQCVNRESEGKSHVETASVAFCTCPTQKPHPISGSPVKIPRVDREALHPPVSPGCRRRIPPVPPGCRRRIPLVPTPNEPSSTRRRGEGRTGLRDEFRIPSTGFSPWRSRVLRGRLFFLAGAGSGSGTRVRAAARAKKKPPRPRLYQVHRDSGRIRTESRHPLLAIRKAWKTWKTRHVQALRRTTLLVLFLSYNAYLVWAVALWSRGEESLEPCEGLGLLLSVTGVAYLALAHKFLFRRILAFVWARASTWKVVVGLRNAARTRHARLGVHLALLLGILAFLVVDGWDEPLRLASAGGIFFFLLVGWLLSKHPGRFVPNSSRNSLHRTNDVEGIEEFHFLLRDLSARDGPDRPRSPPIVPDSVLSPQVNWYQIYWGIVSQFVLGLVIVRWGTGREVFRCLGDKFTDFIAFTDVGSERVFAYLSSGDPGRNVTLPRLFAFKTLTNIFYFNWIMEILYHLGVMQWVIVWLGELLQFLVSTTAAESMNSAANIFVGHIVAAVAIQPYLPLMTPSELTVVIAAGLASVAGAVLVAFVGFGASAAHLVSASFMSAPAALACAKLLHPETEESKTRAEHISMDAGRSTPKTRFCAAIRGVFPTSLGLGSFSSGRVYHGKEWNLGLVRFEEDPLGDFDARMTKVNRGSLGHRACSECVD
ncbi:unnamed protein product [Darwinula stevensoni]|uniref:Uncharacterized protein n=1 Tax=Darwinula stevensoni TaxID=69355 RepID=A0A7R9A3Y2_9CRUS|nr:unnamed protein product [Darwinula stevensoni]CAG0891491.1 unnamed protein product [Darwinula stevensoni]